MQAAAADPALAKQTGAFVNFDMEQYSFKDMTLRIFREVLTEPEFRDWPHVGIAIQAYLTRHGSATCTQLLEWAQDARKCPVWVRLVKGAYWDYETVIAAQNDWPVPVFTQKWQRDANFEKLTRVPARERATGWCRRSGQPQHPQHRARDGRRGAA